MQFSTLALLATAAFAAASPLSECTTEFKKCQTSASALTLLSSCTITLASCMASGATDIVTESLNETSMTAAQKQAYKKCQMQFNACRVAPGANMSTCSSKAVACFEEVKEE